MNDAVARASASALERLATVPHRFFFLAGMVALALDSLWWLNVQAARAFSRWPALPGTLPETAVHGLLMIDGFLPMFMFGFLFTAGPRWLSVEPPSPKAWRPAALLAAAGGVAPVIAQLIDATLVRAVAGLYAAAWLWLLTLFLRLILQSRAPDKVHAVLVMAALTAGAGTLVAFAILASRAHPWLRDIGVWCFLVPVFATVWHRMIPFFAAGVLPHVRAFRPWCVLSVTVGAAFLHAALSALGVDGVTWLTDLRAAAFLWLLVLRRPFRTHPRCRHMNVAPVSASSVGRTGARRSGDRAGLRLAALCRPAVVRKRPSLVREICTDLLAVPR